MVCSACDKYRGIPREFGTQSHVSETIDRHTDRTERWKNRCMYVPDENKDNDDDNGNKKKMDQWLPFNILIIFFRVNYMSIPHKKQSVTALIFIVFCIYF